jgi:red chlorophyll catabolite reductase
LSFHTTLFFVLEGQIARETMTLPLCPHPHVYLNSFSALPLKKISTRKIRNSIRALSTTPSEMEQPMRGQRLMEFPHLLAPHKDLMVGLISAVDKRLHGHLLPSSASVPPDAEYYQNQSGASQGSLCINRGVDSSHVLSLSL